MLLLLTCLHIAHINRALDYVWQRDTYTKYMQQGVKILDKQMATDDITACRALPGVGQI